MPNWCSNILIVRGDKKLIKKFKRKAKGKDTDLSLDNFVPMPKEFEKFSSPVRIVSEEEYKKAIKEKEKGNPRFQYGLPMTKEIQKKLLEKYGCDNWYDWCVENWGTKWDVEAELVDESEIYLRYEFDSAWSPPIDWLEEVAKQFPKLHFKLKYEEEGMGFMGIAIGENGEVIDKYLEY